MATSDSILHKINKKFVSLDSDDKKYVATHYQRVLEKLITTMKYKDSLFNEIYKELSYAGSYYDGLKICKPEEFDVNVVIELPIDYTEMALSNKNVPSGFIKVKALRLQELQKDTNSIYKNMQKWTDHEGFLRQSEFRKWMLDVVDKALDSLPHQRNNAQLVVEGEVYQILRRPHGPAITLNVTLPDGEAFDVDLVPVLEFKCSEHWPPQVRRNPFPEIESWCIVPKMNSKNQKEVQDTFWRLSFNEQEREIINDKGHLKSTCRLIKKLRDRQELHRVCSYYIKTVILWKVDEKDDTDPNFWKDASLSQQFLEVLKSLAKNLTETRIEYYWDTNFNLLDGSGMTDVEKINAGRTLSKIISEIEKKMHKNPTVFAEQLLTADEFATFTNESQEESQIAVPGVGVGAIYFQSNDRPFDGTVAALQSELVRLRGSFESYKLSTGRQLKKLSEDVDQLKVESENQQYTSARQQSGIGKLFRKVNYFESIWFMPIAIICFAFYMKFLDIENKCCGYSGGSTEDTITKVIDGGGAN